MANTVKLTFEADTKDAVTGFDDVGGAAKRMSDEVDDASSGMSRAGDAADGAEGKARGFADTLSGGKDVLSGFGEAMKGNLFEGAVMAGTGVADLAGGFKEFLLPMLEKTRIAALAQAATQKVVAAASKVWAGVQWLVNAALTANPIGLIVVGIGILIGVIIYLVRNTKFFGDAWRVVWGGVKAAAVAVWEWLKKVPGWIADVFGKIPEAIGDAFSKAWKLLKDGWLVVSTWLRDKIGKTWEWLKGLPGGLKTVFLKVVDFVTLPFRTAFNLVADLWNKTLGSVKWSVPDWVPGIGGKTLGFPQMPHIHAGGVVPGVAGTAVPILALAGERVLSPADRGGGGQITIGSDGSRLGDALVDLLADAMRGRGGEPAALGIRLAGR
jgi:phage-related protein